MKFWQKYQKAIIKRLIALMVMVLIVAYSYILRSVDYDYISGKVALGERYALSENPNILLDIIAFYKNIFLEKSICFSGFYYKNSLR